MDNDSLCSVASSNFTASSTAARNSFTVSDIRKHEDNLEAAKGVTKKTKVKTGDMQRERDRNTD